MKVQILKLISEYLYKNNCDNIYKSIFHSIVEDVQELPNDLKSFKGKGFIVSAISYTEIKKSLNISPNSLFDSLAILNQIGLIKSVSYFSNKKHKVFYSLGDNNKLYVDEIIDEILRLSRDNEINYPLIQYYFNKKRGILSPFISR